MSYAASLAASAIVCSKHILNPRVHCYGPFSIPPLALRFGAAVPPKAVREERDVDTMVDTM